VNVFCIGYLGVHSLLLNCNRWFTSFNRAVRFKQRLQGAWPVLVSTFGHIKLNLHVLDWVCIDSISEIAEVVLNAEKKLTKDPRKAYMEMADQMTALVRAFRDLPKNVYMAAKQDKAKDEVTGGFIYGPSAPGQKLAASLPYFFDFVLVLHNWKDAEGNIQSALQTQRDAQYDAKDRSGKLDLSEPASLQHIRNKIINQTGSIKLCIAMRAFLISSLGMFPKGFVGLLVL